MSDSEDDDNLRPPRKKSKWINSDSESDFVKEENSTDEFDTDEDSIIKRKTSGASRQVDSTSEEILDSDESKSESGSESEEEYDSENDPDRDPTAIKVLSDDSSSDDSVDRYESVKESANFQEDITQNEVEEDGGNVSSSSGDENSECCAICLSKLSPQKLPSMPDADGCDHKFCRECLVEWSKQVGFSQWLGQKIF